MGDFKSLRNPTETEGNSPEVVESMFQSSSRSFDFDDSHAPLALLGGK